MIKQYLFGGPHDGKIVEVGDRHASLPVLTVGLYTFNGRPVSLEDYELRPFDRRDRRYHRGSRPYPMPGVTE